MMEVLIETLWNVKIVWFEYKNGYLDRINRNIVECKGGCAFLDLKTRTVLIETLWNVKAKENANNVYKYKY